MSQGFTQTTIVSAPLPLAVANGGTSTTTSTGTGSVVLNTSPTLITPNLGTPSTLVLTNSTGDQLGSTDGSNATAGHVGEYISSFIINSSAITLTSTVTATLTSINLTPGDWDVSYNVGFLPAATTNISKIHATANTIAAALPFISPSTPYSNVLYAAAGVVVNVSSPSLAGSTARENITVNTTIYLNVLANFTVSTLKAYGYISARRVR